MRANFRAEQVSLAPPVFLWLRGLQIRCTCAHMRRDGWPAFIDSGIFHSAAQVTFGRMESYGTVEKVPGIRVMFPAGRQ
jgi:hypothetical protein